MFLLLTGFPPVCRATCDRRASDPRTCSPLTSKSPPHTNVSANQAIMSFPTEEPAASSTAEVHSTVNVTRVQQTNVPEARHVGDKALQNSTATPRNFQCAACDYIEPPWTVWQAPCKHGYCNACLDQLFRLSLEDEILYPPRCCQQIMPWSEVREFVSWRLMDDFEGKKEELDTQDRTYCSDPTCSTFIGACHIASDTAAATCPTCQKLTCVA